MKPTKANQSKSTPPHPFCFAHTGSSIHTISKHSSQTALIQFASFIQRQSTPPHSSLLTQTHASPRQSKPLCFAGCNQIATGPIYPSPCCLVHPNKMHCDLIRFQKMTPIKFRR